MSATSFQRDNHYVPCVYLKGFAVPGKPIATYRLLVPHHKVPLWKRHSIRGIAYHEYLYTRVTAGGQTDEIEKWLAREFESPAEEALRRALADEQLKPNDWDHLIRFVAAQDVRTPARLLQNLKRWETEMPEWLNDALAKTAQELERAKKTGVPPVQTPADNSEYIPLRVSAIPQPDQTQVALKAETISGRGLWLFSIKHTLTVTIKTLHQNEWTILKPPDGMTWFTSDNPVIRLNYSADGKYDFGGGWGSPKSEILLPLGPRHLLYTMVGEKRPRRGATVPRHQAEMIRRFIAENAYRMIFSMSLDDEVSKLRPRVVDENIVRSEFEQWRKWNDEQSAAERQLRGWH
jgi:hypothetical protein